jgi:drug/metabolite transporter (DMT)-like permease
MASMLIWAAGLPAADTIIDKVPPLAFAAARMSLAALTLLPVWLLVEGTQALRAANWPLGFLIGGATIGTGAFLLVVGQGVTGPVTVAVISATMPVIGIAIEVLLDGRRLRAGHSTLAAAVSGLAGEHSYALAPSSSSPWGRD